MADLLDPVRDPGRRTWLRGAGAALLLGALQGCGATIVGGSRSNGRSRLPRILERGELVAGVLPDYEPQSSVDPQRGIWTGFDVEVLEALAQLLGVRIRFESRPWTAMYPALDDGSLDVVMQSVVTDERASRVTFLDPVVHGVHFVTLVHARDERDLLGWSELAGLRVGVGKGFAAAQMVARYPGIKAVSYANTIDALRDVAANTLDAVVEDNLLANYHIKSMRLPVRIAAPLTAPTRIAFSVRHGDHEMQQWLNAAIREFVGGVAYLGISRKWFGIDASKPTIGY